MIESLCAQSPEILSSPCMSINPDSTPEQRMRKDRTRTFMACQGNVINDQHITDVQRTIISHCSQSQSGIHESVNETVE